MPGTWWQFSQLILIITLRYFYLHSYKGKLRLRGYTTCQLSKTARIWTLVCQTPSHFPAVVPTPFATATSPEARTPAWVWGGSGNVWRGPRITTSHDRHHSYASWSMTVYGTIKLWRRQERSIIPENCSITMALVSHFSLIMAIFTLPFPVLRDLSGSPPGLLFPGAHTDVITVRYRTQARLRSMSSMGSHYKWGPFH